MTLAFGLSGFGAGMGGLGDKGDQGNGQKGKISHDASKRERKACQTYAKSMTQIFGVITIRQMKSGLQYILILKNQSPASAFSSNSSVSMWEVWGNMSSTRNFLA